MISDNFLFLRESILHRPSSKFAKVSLFSIFIPVPFFFNSFVISSLSVAYSITDRIHHCLILLFIVIFFSPCFALILAVSPVFIFLIISRFFPEIPFFFIA